MVIAMTLIAMYRDCFNSILSLALFFFLVNITVFTIFVAQSDSGYLVEHVEILLGARAIFRVFSYWSRLGLHLFKLIAHCWSDLGGHGPLVGLHWPNQCGTRGYHFVIDTLGWRPVTVYRAAPIIHPAVVGFTGMGRQVAECLSNCDHDKCTAEYRPFHLAVPFYYEFPTAKVPHNTVGGNWA